MAKCFAAAASTTHSNVPLCTQTVDEDDDDEREADEDDDEAKDVAGDMTTGIARADGSISFGVFFSFCNSPITLASASAFPEPVHWKTILFAAHITGRVNVTRLGGGFGESAIQSINNGFSDDDDDDDDDNDDDDDEEEEEMQEVSCALFPSPSSSSPPLASPLLLSTASRGTKPHPQPLPLYGTLACGLSGNKEHIWPSGPMPSRSRSKLGTPRMDRRGEDGDDEDEDDDHDDDEGVDESAPLYTFRMRCSYSAAHAGRSSRRFTSMG